MIHAILFGILALGPFPQEPKPAQDAFAKQLFPLSRPVATPEVTIDVADAPDAKPWAERAAKLVTEWWPLLSPLLATDNYTPPKTLRLIFKPGINNPAFTSGAGITCSADWIKRHPEDFGMVIHEMVHMLQRYPGGGNKPGWLVEGIADYIRWWRYEPEAPRTRINPDRASYRDSYRVTAAFLAYLTAHYDHGLVKQLDQALRIRSYTDELFKTACGKPLDDLWAEYVATQRPRVP